MKKLISKKRIVVGLSHFMQFLMALYFIIALVNLAYGEAALSIVVLLLSLIPSILKRKTEIQLPFYVNFFFVLMLYLHLNGYFYGFYETSALYDKFGHFVGSASIALLGYASVIITKQYTKVRLYQWSTAVFIIIFTLAIGAFWEIIEFTSDILFGTTTQAHPSLSYHFDTMTDLILDLAGGLVIAALSLMDFDNRIKKDLFKNLKKIKKKTIS